MAVASFSAPIERAVQIGPPDTRDGVVDFVVPVLQLVAVSALLVISATVRARISSPPEGAVA